MITLKISSNASDIAKAFDAAAKKQVAFATSVAINKIAQLSRDALKIQMQNVFDRPRPFTLNSLFVKNSNKYDLTATVGHKDRGTRGTPAAQYLQAQLTGGSRKRTPFETKAGSEFLVPAQGVRKDAYGNVAKGVRSGIIDSQTTKKGNYFVINEGSKSHLQPGIYQRIANKTKTRRSGLAGRAVAVGGGSRLKAIMLFVPSVRYSKRYDMIGAVERTINQNFSREFAAAMDNALSTAKK